MISASDIQRYLASEHSLVISNNDPLLAALLAFQPMLDRHSEQLLETQQQQLETFGQMVQEQEKKHEQRLTSLHKTFLDDLRRVLEETSKRNEKKAAHSRDELLLQQTAIVQRIERISYASMAIAIVCVIGVAIAAAQ